MGGPDSQVPFHCWIIVKRSQNRAGDPHAQCLSIHLLGAVQKQSSAVLGYYWVVKRKDGVGTPVLVIVGGP